jgi:rubredoxin
MSEYKRYLCVVCGHIYDEKNGDIESKLVPGTRWKDVPEDWVCPDCGASKDEFELIVD